MEVYVDNVKVEMKQKKFKSLGNAISAINKKLMKENKIPHEIYVNGSTLRDNSIVVGKDLKVIEVITKTHGAMILESILIAKESIDRYFDIFDDIEESGQESLNDEVEIQLIEMVIFLRWFYNLLLLIKENHILDFIYEDFDEYKLTLTLVIENDQIKEIKDISGDGGKSNSFYIKAASKGVVSQILQKNSTEGIDTVSSATCSSKAIIEACQKALEQAKN